MGAIGAAVARFPDTEEVTGSIPVSRTLKTPGQPGVLSLSASVRAPSVPYRISNRRLEAVIPLDRVGYGSAARSQDSAVTVVATF